VVFYHGIGANDLEFVPCLHTTSYLKLKLHLLVHLFKRSLAHTWGGVLN